MGCCIGACLCSACEGCCPSIKGRGSRIPYLVLIFVVCALGLFMRYGLSDTSMVDWLSFDVCGETDDLCWGNQTVYRICFALFVFFAVHFLLLLIPGCGPVHTHCWCTKLLLFVGLIVLTYFMPDDFFNQYTRYFARPAAGLFLVMQIVSIVNFAYHINERIVTMFSEHEGSPLVGWLKIGYLVFCAAAYILCVVLMVLFFGWFADSAGGECGLQKMYIIVTIIGCIVFTALSMAPLTEDNSHGSLLTSAIVTVYCTYLLFSALSSDTSACNSAWATRTDSLDLTTTDAWQLVLGMVFAAVGITYSAWSLGGMRKQFGVGEESDVEAGAAPTVTTVSSPAAAASSGGDKKDPASAAAATKSEEKAEPAMTRAEQKEHCFFHLVLTLASLYLSMLLSNWGAEATSSEAYNAGPTSMWVKIVSQWVTMLLFVWTTVAPCVCRGRDFS